jgi:small-conductance mechanosensitive channel
MKELPISFYSASVTAVLFLIYIILITLMKGVERRKRKLLEKRKTLESMVTESPIDENYEEALTRGLENIETRFGFFRKVLLPMTLGLWIIFLGIPYLDTASKTYTSIIFTIITVFLSIAAKPFVENLFAGLVISFSNSARIGDTVEIDGHYGTVEEINLTYTTIKVWDWRRYLVPNAKLISKEFLNYSLTDKHIWACIEFYVEPDGDLELIEKEIIEITKKSPFFNTQKFEDPQVWNMGVEKDAIKLWLAAWAKNPSTGWSLKSDMRKAVINTLKKHGLKPQLSSVEFRSPLGASKLHSEERES